jgi:hypothetical protein
MMLNANQSLMNANPNLSMALKSTFNRRCVTEVKDQKQILLAGSEPFSFDFVGSEDVS